MAVAVVAAPAFKVTARSVMAGSSSVAKTLKVPSPSPTPLLALSVKVVGCSDVGVPSPTDIHSVST